MIYSPKPLIPVNPEGWDELASSLLIPSTAGGDRGRPPIAPHADKYMLLPEKHHGSYSYPDLLVETEITHLGSNWDQTHEALKQDNAYMLTIRQFADLLTILKSGRVYNGAGNLIDTSKVNAMLEDIITVRPPYRAEWLDAKFSKKKKKWYITYHYLAGNSIEEELEDCLRKNRTPGINLDSWLASATRQGLPSPSTPSGSLYYLVPQDGTVARFYAGSGGASLGCDWGPRGSDSGLGVRRARKK